MSVTTESQFYARVKAECDARGYSSTQFNYVAMTCAENGYDCGVDCWAVAISTLEMFIDQGTLDEVSHNEGGH